jgi:hypothetical protein
MRSLLYISFFLPLGVFAQGAYPYDIVAFSPKGNLVAPPDTKPVPQGVIKVRKPVIRPYFKCEYYLTLADVREVEVEVTGPDGYPARDKLPVFDSTRYSQTFERIFPQKENHFSRQLVDTIDFCYSFEDTASIDTMFVEMWIGSNGKVRWKDADTVYAGQMPAALRSELYRYVMSITDWGKGGGYKEPKKFMRKQRRAGESYYCQLFIIASAKPLTAEQRHTGARYAPFDIPLNSPPGDEQQRDFIEGNRDNPKNDTIRK